MIKLKRLNGKEFVVNCELIQYLEETPDTVITLTTGTKIVVAETVDEIIEKVIEYKASILDYSRNARRKEV
ncbi:MAG: flagellar FlbD family protein [Tissierellia bacterium]|nr:flagellar FlbD family protein [Tissierellia bacterium]